MSRGLLLLTGIAACVAEPAPATPDSACGEPVMWAALPDAIRETSGIAASRRHPGVFWTHNDSGNDSLLFAIDSTGTILAGIRVRGATNRDWEDIAVGPCGGPEGDCVFIGDIGDNREHYQRVVVYRVPEPDPATDTITETAYRIPMTYPGGARDAESLFVTDRGIHILPKGRSHAIELFRLQPPYRSDRNTELQVVQQLAPPPTNVSAQVTAAAVSPDFSTVVVRGYAAVRFFEMHADTLRPLGQPSTLLIPGMAQGEGVDFLDDGRLVLSGEASAGFPAALAVVACDPRGAAGTP